jgi:hypothetical protein
MKTFNLNPNAICSGSAAKAVWPARALFCSMYMDKRGTHGQWVSEMTVSR